MSQSLPLQNSSLFPDYLRRPQWLLWVWALPIGILLLFNYHAWWLSEGDMSSEQRSLAVLWGIFNLANLIAAWVAYFLLKWRRSVSGWGIGVVLVVLQCAYLWFTMAHVGEVLPQTVQTWILPPDRLLFTQWTWVMPPAFFGVLLLAGFPLMGSYRKDIGYSAAAIVLGPLLIYLSFTVLDSFVRNGPSALLIALFLFLFITATLLLGLGLIRILLLIFSHLLAGRAWVMSVLVLLFALIMPLGGLILNRYIPFPADYQGLWVYVLTVLNAIVLIIPITQSARINLVLLLLRCLLFPFTLYFFLVFLPFLPLSILAILAVASGFLVLTPTILFVVHLLRLREVWLAPLPCGRASVFCLGLIAFAVLPGWITLQSLYLGRQLERGLNWVYAPDAASQEPFDGNPMAVEKACLWLRDYKNGRFLPYLTPYRQWLMFDGLVLPDDKLARIYEAFSGESYDRGEEIETLSFGFFQFQRTNRAIHRMPQNWSPNRDVKLQSLQSATVSDAGISRTTLRLDIHPQSSDRQSEYVSDFTLPKGVLVSGFWLHIDGERVPGRIFEKKAALWVYQMIRDTSRQDPGLLFYTGPDELRLLVFPLEPGQTRTVELELMYPEGFAWDVTIDDKNAILGEIQRVALSAPNTAAAVLNKPALDELPLIQRKPYWHFIVDHSLKAPPVDDILERIAAVQALSPSIVEWRASLASFETTEYFDNLDDLKTGLLHPVANSSGGFLPDRAIMQSLTEYAQNSLRTDANYEEFPVFVMITNQEDIPWTHDLRLLADWTPEMPGVLIAAAPLKIYSLDWQGSPVLWEVDMLDQQVSPVSLLAMGDSVRPVRNDLSNATCFFAPDSAGQPLRFLESENRTFVPLSESTVLPADNPYAQALGLLESSLAPKRNPALLSNALPELVKASKAQGILIPQTSYMVVENHAQWRILEQKEKDKLEGNPELELMETPEPAIWLLGGLLIALEVSRRYKRRET
jgi:hypothetical protein